MNQYSNIVYWLRWAILLIGLTCISTGLIGIVVEMLVQNENEVTGEAILLVPFWFTLLLTGGNDWLFGGEGVLLIIIFFLGVILRAQWLVLRPRQDWQVKLAETGRPMKTARAAAAFMAMLLSVGVIATLLEIQSPESWKEIINSRTGFYAVMLFFWVLWAVVFYVYWKEGERFTQLGDMIRDLVVGSFLELFIAIGVYAWNPHDKNDCYCERGSFTGLVFGATVMIWAFGPGLLLLFLKKHRDKREKIANSHD